MTENSPYQLNMLHYTPYFYPSWIFYHQTYAAGYSEQTNFQIYSQKNMRKPNELQEKKIQEKNNIQEVKFQITQHSKGKKERKEQKKNRDEDYRTKPQKKDRNMNSILIRNFTTYIHKNSKKQIIFNKIVDKYHLSIKFHEFYSYFKAKMPLGKSYIGVNQFFNLILINDNFQISLISRIMFANFINLDIYPAILRSNRIRLFDKIKEIKHKSKLIEEINKKVIQIQKQKHISQTFEKE